MSHAQQPEHLTVLREQAVDALNIKPAGIYVDGTFGRGGHSLAILARLNESGHLYVFDKDPDAIEAAKEIQTTDKRLSWIHGSFATMVTELQQQNVHEVDGVLLDLGVSSVQLDSASRGFSFQEDGPLDMRMNTMQAQTAAHWLNETDEAEIARVLKVYGEERFARRIAHTLVKARADKPIETTAQLADLVARAVPKKEKHKHPATRTFQAIRIQVNQELLDLENALGELLQILRVGGRLVVISFHSLEDRIVKRFIRLQHQGEEDLLPDLPIQGARFESILKPIGKPVRPDEQEIAHNPRARSAIMRVAERVA